MAALARRGVSPLVKPFMPCSLHSCRTVALRVGLCPDASLLDTCTCMPITQDLHCNRVPVRLLFRLSWNFYHTGISCSSRQEDHQLQSDALRDMYIGWTGQLTCISLQMEL